MVGRVAGEFVGGTAVEMDLEFAEIGFGNDNRAFRKSDLGTAFAAGLGEKYTVPVCAGGGNIVDVENGVREVFIENAGLNEIGHLGGDEGRFGVTAKAKRIGGEPKGHRECKAGAEDRKDADGHEDAAAADAERGEGNDFGVHGHAAEAEKDADEDGHRDGEDEDTGNHAEEERDNLRA